MQRFAYHGKHKVVSVLALNGFFQPDIKKEGLNFFNDFFFVLLAETRIQISEVPANQFVGNLFICWSVFVDEEAVSQGVIEYECLAFRKLSNQNLNDLREVLDFIVIERWQVIIVGVLTEKVRAVFIEGWKVWALKRLHYFFLDIQACIVVIAVLRRASWV